MSGSHVKSSCVAETLRDILKAQHASEDTHHKNKSRCRSACCNAIDELLHPVIKKKNTIPFILYTKDGCPFKAEGVTTYLCKCCNEKKFKCFSTFIFRLSEIKHDCVILELLTFKNSESCSCSHDASSPCCQIDGEKVSDLIRTGICIKADPSCFCSISCLPPMNLDPQPKKAAC